MQSYVTGEVIRGLREKRRLTQRDLAQQLNVSDKTVSKWETGRGLPDITLLEPLAGALSVSVTRPFFAGFLTRKVIVMGVREPLPKIFPPSFVEKLLFNEYFLLIIKGNSNTVN